MARPRKRLNKDQVREVETLAAVLTTEQIADYFGIARDTFNEIKGRQPDVSSAYKKGRSKGIASVSSNLLTQAKNGNTSAAIFYLKTQAGWSENQPDSDQEAPPLNITFNVNKAVDEVKVTNARA